MTQISNPEHEYAVVFVFDAPFLSKNNFHYTTREGLCGKILVYNFSIFKNTLRKDIELWARDSITGRTKITNRYIGFEKESDAMLFKLTWC